MASLLLTLLFWIYQQRTCLLSSFTQPPTFSFDFASTNRFIFPWLYNQCERKAFNQSDPIKQGSSESQINTAAFARIRSSFCHYLILSCIIFIHSFCNLALARYSSMHGPPSTNANANRKLNYSLSSFSTFLLFVFVGEMNRLQSIKLKLVGVGLLSPSWFHRLTWRDLLNKKWRIPIDTWYLPWIQKTVLPNRSDFIKFADTKRLQFASKPWAMNWCLPEI